MIKHHNFPHLLPTVVGLFFLFCTPACNRPEPDKNINEGNDGDTPAFDSAIHEYDGETADDAGNDVAGSDEDLYWEANSFKHKVTITYNANEAIVETDNSEIEYYTDGAHVVLDMQTHAVSGVEVEITGRSEDGSLKIYGTKKYKLTLSGVELTSSRGPALNSQCKKRIYVHLTEGTTNRLTDAVTYGDDIWYIAGSDVVSEDRKGCFFSEGNLIFSGTGVLVVAGRQKHGIATDGYFFTRPGITIAVTEAAKNAIHVKGDSGDAIGIRIGGGLIYANVSSEAGKCIKTNLDAEILGGKLNLNTSGGAVYDAEEKDTSSAAAIKADGNILIAGGVVIAKSTGTGGKGLNADGSITFTGGETTITTTGGKYKYSSSLTSSPKGVKADGDILIEGGKLNISVTGASDGSEGIESKAILTINGGEIYVYAYDDAINAASGIDINGGRIYAYSVNNDGIDSNGYLHFNGGLTIASAGITPEESFDCDNSNLFLINGGTLIGTAPTYMETPSTASKQNVVLYSGLSLTKNERIAILDSSGILLLSYDIPRSINSTVLFFSSPDLTIGETYTISKSGTLTGYTDSWNGWYEGGSWSGGISLGTFTISSGITKVGASSGMGGPGGGGNPGGGNNPGGNPPGGRF